uniref:Kinesin light chain n=1 Tax=Bionectria ochroleuca TaxID=29856 RepID=A0A0B7KSK7_BIOOC
MTEKLGEDHPHTLKCIGSLATAYRNHGRYQAAQDLLDEVVKTWNRSPGIEHPGILSSMEKLALVLMEQGQYQESEKLLKQVIETQSPRETSYNFHLYW